MKKIVLSFDDGRVDNFTIAYPLMKKYNIKGTFFVTTGYIDGTWKNNGWRSAAGPLTIKQLEEMKKDGFEIACHGDKHTTNISDFQSALCKLNNWGFADDLKVGYSLPNSNLDEESIKALRKEYQNSILYVRGGAEM